MIISIENVPTVSYKKTLYNNVIQEDLQSVLRPLNLMQSILFCAKYSIRDNIINSNTRVSSFLRVLCMFLLQCTSFYYLVVSNVTFSDSNMALKVCFFVCSTADFFLLFIGDLINSYLNITYSYYNILLVLKIQYVLRFLQINKTELKSVFVCNWICIISLNIFYILYITYLYLCFFHVSIISFILAYASIAFDLNIMYALLVLMLVQKLLQVWIENVSKLRNNEDSYSEVFWDKTFNIYLNIQEIFIVMETIFRHMVSFYHSLQFDKYLPKIKRNLCTTIFEERSKSFHFIIN